MTNYLKIKIISKKTEKLILIITFLFFTILILGFAKVVAGIEIEQKLSNKQLISKQWQNTK